MGRRRALRYKDDWKKMLWQATAVGIGIAVVLVLLSSWMRVIFLVGILYGLSLPFVVFILARGAIRIEREEPTGPISNETLFKFPFAHAGNYPQLIILLAVGGLTIILAPVLAGAGWKWGGDSRFPPGNVEIEAIRTSSNAPNSKGAYAFDGDLSQGWNSGGWPPAWLEVDMGKPIALTEIRLCLSTSPDCKSTHELWISDSPIGNNRQAAKLMHTFDGGYRKGDVLRFSFPEGSMARYVQIHTTKTVSWVSWFEIAIHGK